MHCIVCHQVGKRASRSGRLRMVMVLIMMVTR